MSEEDKKETKKTKTKEEDVKEEEVKEEKKPVSKKPIKTFHLPAKGLTIKATSLAEALVEAEKLNK